MKQKRIDTKYNAFYNVYKRKILRPRSLKIKILFNYFNYITERSIKNEKNNILHA